MRSKAKRGLSAREKRIALTAYGLGLDAGEYPFHGYPQRNEVFKACVEAAKKESRRWTTQ